MIYAAMPDELNTYIDIVLLDSLSLESVNTILEDDEINGLMPILFNLIIL
jgi:hypothetical protein